MSTNSMLVAEPMNPNDRSNVFRLFPARQITLVSYPVHFGLLSLHMICVGDRTIVRQGAERNQRQRLDEYRQREGIHSEAGGIDLESQEPDHTLVTAILFVWCVGTPARLMAVWDGAVFSRKLLKGQGQKGSWNRISRRFAQSKNCIVTNLHRRRRRPRPQCHRSTSRGSPGGWSGWYLRRHSAGAAGESPRTRREVI